MEKEFKALFDVADQNKDGIVEPSELEGFL